MSGRLAHGISLRSRAKGRRVRLALHRRQGLCEQGGNTDVMTGVRETRIDLGETTREQLVDLLDRPLANVA